MKRATGYRTIYQKWIELLCGYELEEGINQLETKDISTLYEIWCFIKVKNIVEEILGNKAEVHNKGKKLMPRFVRELTWGRSSEVTFVRTDDGVELASVMYNAPTKDENTNSQSAILGTTSFTTEQRPDIVLRLTKQQKDIQYTFLFDAKYRIACCTKFANTGAVYLNHYAFWRFNLRPSHRYACLPLQHRGGLFAHKDRTSFDENGFTIRTPNIFGRLTFG